MNSHGVSDLVQPTLESVYRGHRQGLFSVALSITRRIDRAEDAVHDAFARLCRTQTAPTGDAVAYAYAAVRNAAIDITRKRIETSADLTDHAAAKTSGSTLFVQDDAATALMADESQQFIRQAVDALPEGQREVLVMKLYGGLTFDQIAQALGEPLSTVASRYRRALDRLKEQLASVV